MRGHNVTIGKAGEYRVAAELLLRHENVFLPVNDIGIDILTAKGARIQVKCSHKRPAFGTHPARNQFTVKRIRETDFVVLWAIEDNEFYIIPWHLLAKLNAVTVAPSSKWNEFKGRWDLITNFGSVVKPS